MPNWNYNSVTIYAPEKQVKKYLVKQGRELVFNMHLLFPDEFPSTDPTGEKSRGYDWAVEHTGSQSFPAVEVQDDEHDNHITYLNYDTAWAPNNPTLQRLHELTGWMIVNDYEEPGMAFEGTLECIDGTCRDEDRVYQPSCEICEMKKPPDCYDYDADDMICKQCWKEREAND